MLLVSFPNNLLILFIVKVNEILILILYTIMTCFNIACTCLLYVTYYFSPCNVKTPMISVIIRWIEIVFTSLLKVLSIVFFRYDLTSKRSKIKGIILWRPFFLSTTFIGLSPALNLPLYTFSFESCYT